MHIVHTLLNKINFRLIIHISLVTSHTVAQWSLNNVQQSLLTSSISELWTT